MYTVEMNRDKKWFRVYNDVSELTIIENKVKCRLVFLKV